MSEQLLVLPDFLSPEDCRNLISCYEANRPNLRQDTSDYWRDRVLYFTSMPERDRAMKLRMRELVYRQVNLIKQHFRYSGPLYPETVNLVSWPNNLEMTPHVDQDNGFAQRMFAAVGYLNDDYEGGEIYFRRLDRASSPRRE